MDQLFLFGPRIFSVTEITSYVRQVFENDDNLQDVWVQGEISNLSRPYSGHIYFTLKDQAATLRCVIWKSYAMRIRGVFENGMGVEAHGKFGIYEKDGQYQLYIDALNPLGEGRLFQEFIRLKTKLEGEGLFDPERKRGLISHPERIGIVTSSTGAALQDILNTIQHRYPLVEILLASTSVQGESAPAEIVAAINRVNKENPDLIILARGGGSLEDLWAFNDEQVVRAIVNSKVPVITGIGHETDFTLADFAADVRAPTPTGAAVLATPDKYEMKNNLENLRLILDQNIQFVIDSRHSSLTDANLRLEHASPLWQVQNDIQRLDDLDSRLERVMAHGLALKSAQLKGLASHLSSLNPLSILDRGYAIINQMDGKIIHTIQQVQPTQQINIRVSDGQFNATVE